MDKSLLISATATRAEVAVCPFCGSIQTVSNEHVKKHGCTVCKYPLRPSGGTK